MNQARVGLVVAAALMAMPVTALAQPAQPTPKPAKAQAGKKAGKKDASAPAATPVEINLDEPTPPPAQPPPGAPPGEAATGDAAAPALGGTELPTGEGLGDICKIDPSACPTIDLEKAAARELKPPMYAVQQIYALRNHRFEINPYFGLTMNDQFVSHPGPGVGLNFYVTNVVAIGVNGNFYQGLNGDSKFNFETDRAARVNEPLTEYQWSAFGNVTYVPAYGKFAGFGNFIFHWDFFVLGGLGAISTRPIAVVDPDNRTFTFKPKFAGHIGGGLRIFFNRWLAVTFEVSDYIFNDQLENPTIAAGNNAQGVPNAANPSTWLGPTSLTNNVQAQIGLSMFLPFTWDYHLQK